MKQLILVDGSSFLYRAFHALPPLTSSKGQATGAIYGVINMLRRMRKDYEAAQIVVIFDPPGKTFRDDLYKDYKATRPPMPDDLKSQIKPLHQIIKAMGLPLLIIDGFEADDVIGTLAKQAEAKKIPTIIATSDKDMAQLVDPHITLVNTMSNTSMDIAGVKEKFGVAPEQIVDYLTLIGDSVDNIPGVAKVGPKTAAKWLNEYKTLDAIIENADSFSGKIGENLRNSLNYLPLSRILVTIKCDVDLAVKLESLTSQAPQQDELIALYTEMEFKSWLSELLDNGATNNSIKTDYETILTEKQLQDWLKKLKKADYFAIDTETTSLNYIDAQLVGISVAVKAHQAAYIPVAHDYLGAPPQLSRDYVLQQFKPLLENTNVKKLGHHLKYDMSIFANHGINFTGIAYDTMLESYILASTANRHDLDTLALKYLGHKNISFADVAGKGTKQITFNQVELATAAPYAAEDADITWQLHEKLFAELKKEKGMLSVYQTIELPLVPVLSKIERHGVLIDKTMLEAQSKDLNSKIAKLSKKAYKMAGIEFNLDSPKQLQEILFEKLGLPVLKKTPKGQPSTAEAVLHDLSLDYDMPEIILKYRSLSKLKSTYTDKLPLLINSKTGRVHTSYHQAVTATGRLSSSDPNLQNIPIRTEEGQRIRNAFIAPKGYKILAADYSQVELRIMAHLSKDKSLIKAFKDGLDIHKATAAEVFGVALEDVSSDQRRHAKAINFGLIYGMSVFGLAKQIDTDRNTAQEYMDVYFHRYPGVKKYMEDTRKLAHEKGYVETLYGRRLYLPEINSKNFMRRSAAERTAINAPMQGTAADIIKLAMINIDKQLVKSELDAHMIMQVHDELVFEVATKDVEACKELVTKHMQEEIKLSVPVLVDVGIGDNWGEAH